MSQICVTNLTFGYDGGLEDVFQDVSFQLDTDWKLGLTGRNGRGKTTLLRLLMEQNRRPEERKLEYRGKIQASVRFEYFPFQLSDRNQLTEDVIREICPDGELWQMRRELSRLEVDEDVFYRPFDTLSFGEQTKVMLAALFLGQKYFLLIDEPTNHLDLQAREAVGNYLNTKKGFILVSHDRDFLDRCTDHTMSINRNEIQICQGSFSVWYENKQRQDAWELGENERLRKDIRKLETAARQARGWADKSEASKIGRPPDETAKGLRPYIGEKTRKMQRRRKNLERRQERAIEEKSGLLKNIEQAEELKLIPLSYHRERLAVLDHVSVYYGERMICEDISMELRRGERIALEGRNGCGKTTLLKLLLACHSGPEKEETGNKTEMGGKGLWWEGTVEIGRGMKISCVSQDTTHLRGTVADYAEEQDVDLTLMLSILRKLDFSRQLFGQEMSSFSEGQKKKVLIAASLSQQAHLYLWDEPLNYIDIFSRMQIEEMLLSFAPAMVVVEHDRKFLDRVATEIIHVGSRYTVS